jgi:hypothetical protein
MIAVAQRRSTPPRRTIRVRPSTAHGDQRVGGVCGGGVRHAGVPPPHIVVSRLHTGTITLEGLQLAIKPTVATPTARCKHGVEKD